MRLQSRTPLCRQNQPGSLPPPQRCLAQPHIARLLHLREMLGQDRVTYTQQIPRPSKFHVVHFRQSRSKLQADRRVNNRIELENRRHNPAVIPACQALRQSSATP